MSDCCKKEQTISAMLICYINVGQLSFEKAEEYVDKTQSKFDSVLKRLPPYVGVLFVPTREEKTAFEYINFKD